MRGKGSKPGIAGQEKFKRRAVVFDERKPPGDLTPGPEDMGPLRKLVWIEISEPGERSACHP